MDKETLEKLERLREILFSMELNGHIFPTYKQQRTLKKVLGKLSETLYHECIQNYKIRKEIIELRHEFNDLPKRRRYSLGSKGVEILNKIHRLECELEAI